MEGDGERRVSGSQHTDSGQYEDRHRQRRPSHLSRVSDHNTDADTSQRLTLDGREHGQEDGIPEFLGVKVKELVQGLRKRVLLEMLGRDQAERELEERTKEVDSLARVLEALGKELHEKARVEEMLKARFRQITKELVNRCVLNADGLLKAHQTQLEERISEFEERFSMMRTSVGVMSLRVAGNP